MEFVGLSLPFFRVGWRRFFNCYIWPDFRVLRIQQQPFLQFRFGVWFDCVDRAFRYTDPAIDTFVGMDDEHVLAFVEAVHRAYFNAVHDFTANAAVVDDVGQLSTPFSGSPR